MQTGSKESLDALAGFFNELAPRLETAKALDEELDRNLARKFNVLDYLKTDELGLSRIIADLLDPHASHGQGVLFLRAFLERLEGSGKGPEWPELDAHEISVDREKRMDGRSIDVVVEIKDPDGATCLAFENKPYDLDQEDQVRDYLGSLQKLYPGGFLLIYLPPKGEGPSESSIHKDELKKWENHFAIMPYVGRQEEWKDEFDDFRLPHSLADWLGECRKNCEVERLRWFLRDTRTFCQRRFGAQAMSSDCQTKAVQDFVGSDPLKLETAKAVVEAWPEIKNGVFRRFLERLYSAIDLEAKSRFGDDIRVESRFVREAKYPNWIGLYRESWTQYEGAEESLSGRRTAVYLTNNVGTYRPEISLCIAVRNPEKSKEGEREELLAEKLNEPKGLGPAGRPASGWPWWKMVEEHGNWDSLILELERENKGKDNGGEITKYFVDRFIEVAVIAVPIINGIEADNNKV